MIFSYFGIILNPRNNNFSFKKKHLWQFETFGEAMEDGLDREAILKPLLYQLPIVFPGKQGSPQCIVQSEAQILPTWFHPLLQN